MKGLLFMKRFVSMLLALIICCVPIQAFASISNSVGSGSVEFTDRVYSSFDVEIPESMSAQCQQVPVTIANKNFETGYYVEIYANNLNDGILTLFHTEDNKFKKQYVISNLQYDTSAPTTVNEDIPLVTYYPDDDPEDTTLYFAITPFDVGGKAGYYTGTMTYDICLKQQ